jgi:hypothetical protein
MNWRRRCGMGFLEPLTAANQLFNILRLVNMGNIGYNIRENADKESVPIFTVKMQSLD